jgi:hypothetical protein
LVGGPPGVKLHTVFEGLPSRDVGDMVPVVVPTPFVVDADEAAGNPDVVVATETDGIVPIVVRVADMEAPGTAGVTAVI